LLGQFGEAGFSFRAIVLGIDNHRHVFTNLPVEDFGHQVLQGAQGFAPLANEQTGAVADDIQVDLILTHLCFDDRWQVHMLQDFRQNLLAAIGCALGTERFRGDPNPGLPCADDPEDPRRSLGKDFKFKLFSRQIEFLACHCDGILDGLFFNFKYGHAFLRMFSKPGAVSQP